MARPSEYDFELCKEICEEIAGGTNIIRALELKDNYPSWPTFRKWKNENTELLTLYVSSQQDKAIALENEIDDLRDRLLQNEIDYQTYNALVNTLKWKMAKMYPKVFGDKTIHSGDEDNPIQVVTRPRIEFVKKDNEVD